MLLHKHFDREVGEHQKVAMSIELSLQRGLEMLRSLAMASDRDVEGSE